MFKRPCCDRQTTSYFVPVWLLATLRLLILLYVVAEIVIERYTTRAHLQARL